SMKLLLAVQSCTTWPSLMKRNCATPPTQLPGSEDAEASRVSFSPRSMTPSPLASRTASNAVVPWSPTPGLQVAGQAPDLGALLSGTGVSWETITPLTRMSSTHQPSSSSWLSQLPPSCSYDCAVGLNSHDWAIQRILTRWPR